MKNIIKRAFSSRYRVLNPALQEGIKKGSMLGSTLYHTFPVTGIARSAKKYKSLLMAAVILTMAASCHDMEELNVDPNNPQVVSTATLMTGAQKRIVDFIFDEWFSGRQALPYAQYWSQRNYTEEDRFQIRESVNNNYFNSLYTIAGNLVHIENLNTNEATRVEMSAYGDNNNQIAVAKIMKVWLMQVVADTWGSVPYSEAFMLDGGIVYPVYDDLEDIYFALIAELDLALGMINEGERAFTSGDIIYNGDPVLWRMFGNSLKAKVALRLSKVDPNWKTYISEAVEGGLFTSNAHNAVFRYRDTDPDQCYFYRSFFVTARNDFSITRPFTNLLEGIVDELNGKSHPWEGVVDPRLSVFTSSVEGSFQGIPYGVPSNQMTSVIRAAAPNFGVNPPLVLEPDFPIPYLTYAEVCFILSEYEDFSQAWYEEGIRASIDYWDNLNVSIHGAAPIGAAATAAYIDAVGSVANAETVATQKYIHLYMSGTEAWAEYRRTGYPVTMLMPGDISTVVDGENIIFTPLEETKGDLPARVKYPTNESTLNAANFADAISRLEEGTNNFFSKMFWDVRTAENPHPANL